MSEKRERKEERERVIKVTVCNVINSSSALRVFVCGYRDWQKIKAEKAACLNALPNCQLFIVVTATRVCVGVRIESNCAVYK